MSMSNIMANLQSIANQGNFDVAAKLPTPKVQTVNYQTVYPNSFTGVTSTGNSILDRLAAAIKKKESSDNYGAVNRQSGASGAYQVMPSNLQGTGRGWDYEALGKDVSIQQFMKDKAIQDQIARYKLNQYMQKYGTAGAAVAWYGGPGAVANMYSKKTQTGGYPSLYAYWNSVLSKMG